MVVLWVEGLVSRHRCRTIIDSSEGGRRQQLDDLQIRILRLQCGRTYIAT